MASKKKITGPPQSIDLANITGTTKDDGAIAGSSASNRKKANATAVVTTAVTDTAVSDDASTTAATVAGPTLQAACDGYLASMQRAGSATSTIASYRMDLRSALAEFGVEAALRQITPEQVDAYFSAKRVTKLRSGRVKAKASIDKARRVLRLALVWAAAEGMIERAPLPKPPEVL